MKKFVLKLDLPEEQDKRRAMKTVSTLSGIDEITIDTKGKTLTVMGTVDPVAVVSKLRKKNWLAYIISVGPAKEPEEPKKEEAKKEEPPKEEAKKEEPKKEEEKKEEPKKEEEKKEEPKKEEEKKEEPKKEEEEKKPEPIPIMPNYKQYYQPSPYYPPPPLMNYQLRPYYPPPPPPMYYQSRPSYPPPPPMYSYQQVHHSMEENPNSCAIF